MLRVFRPLFLLVAAFLLSGVVGAQTLPAETIDSLDAKVLNAVSIRLGTLKKMNAGTGSFSTTETIRGAPKTQIKGKLRTAADRSESWSKPISPKLLEGWQANATPLLIFEESDGGRIDTIDLQAAASPNLHVVARKATAPVATKDFRVLRDRKAILAYVRKLVRERPNVTKVARMSIRPAEGAEAAAWKKATGEHGDGGLVVPVDEALERRAFAYLRTKDRGRAYEVSQMLEPFKSPRNIERLKGMLDDRSYVVTIPAERFRGIELRDYPARLIAAQTLKSWGVAFQEPETRERASKVATITTLYTTMGDYEPDFALLTDAKRLRELTIE